MKLAKIGSLAHELHYPIELVWEVGKLTSIIIENQTDTVAEVLLAPGHMTIGRSHENDVPIKDAAISHRHAKIVTLFDVSYIEDLDSTNGTFLNGKRIVRHTLHDGDEISLGKHRLKVTRKKA